MPPYRPLAKDHPLTTSGDRVRHVRDLHAMTGREFVELLNSVAEQLGFERYWVEPKLNMTENNKRDLSPSDLAVLEAIDPKGRNWFWFTFGRKQPTVRMKTASGAPKLPLRRPQIPRIDAPRREAK